MERYISDLKTKYLTNLAIYDELDRINEVLDSNLYSPIYKPLIVHEDEKPNIQEHNTMLEELTLDLNALNAELSSSATSYYSLISNYKNQMDSIRDKMNKEYELQLGLNMLCNAYTSFDSVTSIDDNYISISDSSQTDGIMHSDIQSFKKIPLTVSNISGNGYAGNSHVYDVSTGEYITNTFDTSDTIHIVDDNNAQYFEYSRLVSSDSASISVCPEINNDSNSAKCSVYLQSDEAFNTIRINSDQKYLKIVDLYTSLDGLSYNVLKDFHDFDFNNTDNKYTIDNYILNSGIICIPDSKYVKITFSSTDYNSNEIIACQHKSISSSKTVLANTVILNNTQRYNIRINSITAFRNEYASSTSIVSEDLLSTNELDNLDGIAIFANEYIPETENTVENKRYIRYFLIVNDVEYEVEPINHVTTSNGVGTKIIRAANNLNNTSYTRYVSESIKMLKLKIVINAVDKYNTPYISNIKLLKSYSS